jgi:hypothetical protein
MDYMTLPIFDDPKQINHSRHWQLRLAPFLRGRPLTELDLTVAALGTLSAEEALDQLPNTINASKRSVDVLHKATMEYIDIWESSLMRYHKSLTNVARLVSQLYTILENGNAAEYTLLRPTRPHDMHYSYEVPELKLRSDLKESGEDILSKS